MSKKPSGSEFRTRAKEREKVAQKSSALLSSWLNVNDSRGKDDGSCNTSDMCKEQPEAVQEECLTEVEAASSMEVDELEDLPCIAISLQGDEGENDADSVIQPCTKTVEDDVPTALTMDVAQGEHTTHFDIEFKDPGTWPTALSDTERCFIVSGLSKEESVEPDLSNTLRDGRKLTKDWFTKTLSGGQKIHRTWLAYSKSKNALFCIPCKIFSRSNSEQNISALAKEKGLTQWKKLNERIPEHENSLIHKKCFCSWKSLQSSLNKGTGIDRELQDKIALEEAHWRGVLYAIIDVIINLAKQGSPLRGSNSNESLEFGDPRCESNTNLSQPSDRSLKIKITVK
ncbi:zinc finger MYM-type protein 5-like [Diabrotica virgifera virgifera]|uniref:TTF-type domain-containing protein n=1 Tax=Diabrotica virgifera virgifera TaxID=50390 RepID=A0ABM5L3M9_DIAVI|nr:zinc finger MYM-type protein 5-like [Diabrotica virgifera virgifera]